MTGFFALIGVAVTLFVVIRWLRLIGFRVKTLRIITSDLAYEAAVPGFQTDVFNAITREARRNRGAPDDAAISFMLIQLGCLPEPLDKSSIAFVDEKLQLIHKVADNTPQGPEIVREFLDLKQWHTRQRA